MQGGVYGLVLGMRWEEVQGQGDQCVTILKFRLDLKKLVDVKPNFITVLPNQPLGVAFYMGVTLTPSQLHRLTSELYGERIPRARGKKMHLLGPLRAGAPQSKS